MQCSRGRSIQPRMGINILVAVELAGWGMVLAEPEDGAGESEGRLVFTCIVRTHPKGDEACDGLAVSQDNSSQP